jgi:hypothetical protein
MYYAISQILFWLYWLIVLLAGILLVREIMRSTDLKVKISAGIALIPLVVRILLVK